MREKRLKGIEDNYFEWIDMEIALFMVLIASSSVFVMLSLGYSNKKGGYSSRVLGKVLGGKKKIEGHRYEGSSIIEGMGGIEAAQAIIDEETARLEQKRAEQDAKVNGINAIFEKHYGNKTPPSEEEILAELNANDPESDKNKE
ncbi:MAG: hypothetical protein KAS11_00995 [Candidatus Aenigmarchaeota archaeon]|nr:hypothetical protein [Candidatus Aenigmarchaeota archaeon]